MESISDTKSRLKALQQKDCTAVEHELAMICEITLKHLEKLEAKVDEPGKTLESLD